MRVEHIWSGPDSENLGEGIFEISTTHYWIVDGIWPEGTELEARVFYNGVDTYDLDYDLFSFSEVDAVLVYRENSSVPWEVYPDFTITTGNLFSGTGNIRMDFLRKGQYTFANGDPSVLVSEIEGDLMEIQLYPVPANDVLMVSTLIEKPTTVLMDVYNVQGQLLMRVSASTDGTFNKAINVSWLETGNYLLKLRTAEGRQLGVKQFLIQR